MLAMQIPLVSGFLISAGCFVTNVPLKLKPDSGVMLSQEDGYRKQCYETPKNYSNLKLDSCFIVLHTLGQWRGLSRITGLRNL